MNQLRLSDYFDGVAAKNLTAVEIDPGTSNQHEIQGVSALREILGIDVQRRVLPATLLYFDDNDAEPVVESTNLTWYDARKNQADRSPEWRLYFPKSTMMTTLMVPGDLLIIGKKPDDSVLLVLAAAGSTIATQLLWLFDLATDVTGPRISVREDLETGQDRLSFSSMFILETIGIDIDITEDTYLERMLSEFDGVFPTTTVFSSFARDITGEVDWSEKPDVSLLAWLDREEVLFRTLERHLLSERLRLGFAEDVDEFLRFSLSVQNRRKSRMGNSLENHLSYLFSKQGILHSRKPKTERNSRPDFVFPGIKQYNDRLFDTSGLTMLAAKSSCKERWRQVLAEAERIRSKHLLTLEPSISEGQTSEMKASNLQLIVPSPIHESYSDSQKEWLMDVHSFLELVRSKQSTAAA